eukprot:6214827-Pleurochrysis_carterae.AAC.8
MFCARTERLAFLLIAAHIRTRLVFEQATLLVSFVLQHPHHVENIKIFFLGYGERYRLSAQWKVRYGPTRGLEVLPVENNWSDPLTH